jgi:hypothetical protein
MVEVLLRLPEELKAKVYKFQCHPVAELVIDYSEKMKVLQFWFPHLTLLDMLKKRKKDKQTGMCMLYTMMVTDSHRNVFKFVAMQFMNYMKFTMCKKTAFLVLGLLKHFNSRKNGKLYKRTPEDALTWYKNNVNSTKLYLDYIHYNLVSLESYRC